MKIQFKLCNFGRKRTLKIITSRLKCYRLFHFVVGLEDCASQCNGLAYLVTLRSENFNRGIIFRIVYRSLVIYVDEHVKMITTKHKRTKWMLMIRSKMPKSR
ncbi:hypothetical protein Hanom_Chr05g00458571 [Helianthus anomalus]